jgi:hypothetical protein
MPPKVFVVAPVMNMSGSSEWDPMAMTDTLASELASAANVVVIPPNRSRAALALRGKMYVESPEEAQELAQELGADGTVVAAITEYQPYDQPRLGMTLQVYGAGGDPRSLVDPLAASRMATEYLPAGGFTGPAAPIQAQRYFDASDREVQSDIRSYDRRLKRTNSPYGWRAHVKSQTLFVRYCCRTMVESIFSAPAGDEAAAEAEATAEKSDGAPAHAEPGEGK